MLGEPVGDAVLSESVAASELDGLLGGFAARASPVCSGFSWLTAEASPACGAIFFFVVDGAGSVNRLKLGVVD